MEFNIWNKFSLHDDFLASNGAGPAIFLRNNDTISEGKASYVQIKVGTRVSYQLKKGREKEATSVCHKTGFHLILKTHNSSSKLLTQEGLIIHQRTKAYSDYVIAVDSFVFGAGHLIGEKIFGFLSSAVKRQIILFKNLVQSTRRHAFLLANKFELRAELWTAASDMDLPRRTSSASSRLMTPVLLSSIQKAGEGYTFPLQKETCQARVLFDEAF